MKLNVRAAAKRAGVCTNVIYGWCRAKVLPHFRLGLPGRRGKLVIEDADLDAFLAACRVEARPESVPAPQRRQRHSGVKLNHLRL